MRIASARRLIGTCDVPGDKSISHRAALIAALAEGTSIIENFSTGQDCTATLSCLSELGIGIKREGTTVRVDASSLHQPTRPLNCGNSGSTMRMLAGVIASHSFEATLVGDASLNARPMNRVVAPLKHMGAHVTTNNGYPPVQIRGSRSLKAIGYEMPVASAQVKTALLLAGLRAQGRTVVTEHTRTRDHTERMLRWFGVPVESSNDQQSIITAVSGPVKFEASNIKIPGDFSSAAYFIAAATMLPGSELELSGVGLNPTRTQLLEVMRAVNAEVETFDIGEVCNEPAGTIRVRGNSLERWGTENIIEGESIAALIDELPLLAVIATQLPGGLKFRDAGELRVKETDRIAATVKNLRAMGAEVEECEEGFAVKGPVRLKSATIHSFGDHRIAMAFSVAALLADGESEIIDSECVAVSFPDFFPTLESVVER